MTKKVVGLLQEKIGWRPSVAAPGDTNPSDATEQKEAKKKEWSIRSNNRVTGSPTQTQCGILLTILCDQKNSTQQLQLQVLYREVLRWDSRDSERKWSTVDFRCFSPNIYRRKTVARIIIKWRIIADRNAAVAEKTRATLRIIETFYSQKKPPIVDYNIWLQNVNFNGLWVTVSTDIECLCVTFIVGSYSVRSSTYWWYLIWCARMTSVQRNTGANVYGQ